MVNRQPWNIGTEINGPNMSYHHLPPKKFYLAYIAGHRGNPLPPKTVSGVNDVIPKNHPDYATKWLSRLHQRELHSVTDLDAIVRPLENKTRHVVAQFKKDAIGAAAAGGETLAWKGRNLKGLNNYSALFDKGERNPYKWTHADSDVLGDYNEGRKYRSRAPMYRAHHEGGRGDKFLGDLDFQLKKHGRKRDELDELLSDGMSDVEELGRGKRKKYRKRKYSDD